MLQTIIMFSYEPSYAIVQSGQVGIETLCIRDFSRVSNVLRDQKNYVLAMCGD